VLSQVYVLSPEQREQQLQWIAQATQAFAAVEGIGQIDHSRQSIRVLEVQSQPQMLWLKWELHGEFVVHTWLAPATDGAPPPSRAELLGMTDRLLADAGLEIPAVQQMPRICAMDVLMEAGSFYEDAAKVALRFAGHTLVGGRILTNRLGQVWTDWQWDDQGFVQFLVRHEAMGSRQLGRVAQRLIDIETYRMMAMLAFPPAKALGEPLRQAEAELAALAQRLAQTPQQVDVLLDESLLRDVTSIAARVEGWVSEHGLRFTAGEAYAELVRRTLLELNESASPGVQPLSEFMDRRFEPAMRTCRWTHRRLRELSDRVSRTTQILRTRLEFTNEKQTQALLGSMDDRAKLQLKLQLAVEGLSVIVLTYYGASLVSYVTKGLKDWGWAVSPELMAGLSVPLIALALSWFLKKKLH
jgi:uncharacterized membrane-anchored protein